MKYVIISAIVLILVIGSFVGYTLLNDYDDKQVENDRSGSNDQIESDMNIDDGAFENSGVLP